MMRPKLTLPPPLSVISASAAARPTNSADSREAARTDLRMSRGLILVPQFLEEARRLEHPVPILWRRQRFRIGCETDVGGAEHSQMVVGDLARKPQMPKHRLRE